MAARPIVAQTSATLYSIRSYRLPSSKPGPLRVKHSEPTPVLFHHVCGNSDIGSGKEESTDGLSSMTGPEFKRFLERAWEQVLTETINWALKQHSRRRYCRRCSTKAARGNARSVMKADEPIPKLFMPGGPRHRRGCRLDLVRRGAKTWVLVRSA